MNTYKFVTHPITGKKIPEFLTGVITPMYMPCLDEKALDEKGFRNMVDFFKETGSIRTLFPRCGLGKMYTYTPEDVKQVIDIVSSQNAGELYFMPGTAGYYTNDPSDKPDPEVYTQQSLELSLYAQEHGADAVVLVIPSALAVLPRQSIGDVIYNYYAKMNDALDIPIIMYHPSGLEKSFQITPEILARVSRLDKIWGMKYSSNDMNAFTELSIAVEEANFSLFAGSEMVYLYVLMLGGLGVIGQGADNVPEILNTVYESFMEGDYQKARLAQLDVNRTVYCAVGTNMSVFGLHYLKHRGVELNAYARRENNEVDPLVLERVSKAIDAILAKYTTK